MHPKSENQKLQRVKTLDRIVGKPFHVLDDGFVRVVDYMGSDASIVQAARVSYGKGTKKISEDRTLIRYLMRHRHTSPFEMCEIKLHIRVPMDCWRQWIRHRTASVNEYSTRYSVAIDSAQKTQPDEWRLQAKTNRQGSTGQLDPAIGKKMSLREKEMHTLARMVYNERLEANIAREQARKDLPLSTYTEAYWKIDLNNLFHFLELRMEEHAQLEIRSYASVIGNEIVRRWCPLAWEAFQDYCLHSMTFSRLELEILKSIASGKTEEARKCAGQPGWLSLSKEKLTKDLERTEFEEKLNRLGLPIPWK